MAILHVPGTVLKAFCKNLCMTVLSKEGAVVSLLQFIVRHQGVG